jgi:hypothetical protein
VGNALLLVWKHLGWKSTWWMQHGLDSHLDQVESRKERLKIADYSITQASLEHVIGPSFRWCQVDIFNGCSGHFGVGFRFGSGKHLQGLPIYPSYLSLAKFSWVFMGFPQAFLSPPIGLSIVWDIIGP